MEQNSQSRTTSPNAFQEVAPNMILDGHTLGAIQVIITNEAWDSLTPEQQDILMEGWRICIRVQQTDFRRS